MVPINKDYARLTALIFIAMLTCLAVYAEEDTETGEGNKTKLVIGLFLVLIGLVTYAKYDQAAFFVVFASQGIIQIIEYLL